MSPGEPSSYAATTVVQVVPLLAVRSLGRRVFDYRLAERAADGARTEDAVSRRPVCPGGQGFVFQQPPRARPDLGASLVGTLVRVPFRARTVVGMVVAEGSSAAIDSSTLLVAEPVDADPVPLDLVELAARMADYYLAPWGACLRAVTPAHLSAVSGLGRGRPVVWLTPGVPRAGAQAAPPPTASGAQAALGPSPTASGAQAAPSTSDSAPQPTEKQRRLLALLPPGGLALAEACRLGGVGRSVADALVRNGWAHSSVQAASPAFAASDLPGASMSVPFERSAEQQAAIAGLLAALAAPEPERRLLWGVTGSGKTEVYLGLLEEVVKSGGGAIVLVPEIALTGQVVARLRARFADKVGVLHSGLSPAQRVREHRRIASGDAQIVVGARSAVFAPLRDVRVVIVDEAHDSSYKQEDEPRYDARTVAWWRVIRSGGLLVEVTATPRIESLAGEIPRLILRERPQGATMPAVEVVDMRRQGGRTILAPRTRQALEQTLDRGEQAVVLLNRRGYAGFLQCEACGEVRMCPHCEVSLTYHRSQRSLVCHHCGLQTPPPSVCPACGKGALSRGGPGTEHLTEELQRSVPEGRLFRLDSDIVSGGAKVREVLAAFVASTPGVLVGTQMVAKGHDFPLVTLVIVADADTGLYVPDFRATERTFQLLVQVSGRAGRAQRPGRVLVQTWNPDVGCIRMAIDRRMDDFYRGESAARERLGYPPFRDLVRIVLSARDEERAEAGARYLADRLRPYLGPDEVQGPARLPRLRARSRWQVSIAAADGESGRALVGRAVEQLRAPYARRGLDVMIDVDPQWFT